MLNILLWTVLRTLGSKTVDGTTIKTMTLVEQALLLRDQKTKSPNEIQQAQLSCML